MPGYKGASLLGASSFSVVPQAGGYLVIRFGEVVKAGNVVQKEVELRGHVLQQHPVFVFLLNHPNLLLEGCGHSR